MFRHLVQSDAAPTSIGVRLEKETSPVLLWL